MISILIITNMMDGTLICITEWVGDGIATIHGMTHTIMAGVVILIMDFTQAGIVHGTTADGIILGIMVDGIQAGTHLGITEDIMDMVAGTVVDTIGDITMDLTTVITQL